MGSLHHLPRPGRRSRNRTRQPAGPGRAGPGRTTRPRPVGRGRRHHPRPPVGRDRPRGRWPRGRDHLHPRRPRRKGRGAGPARRHHPARRPDQAEARSTEQEQALSRARQLRETNAISQATLEDTIARLAEAGAQLDRARRRLDDRTIKAPFAGVVGLTEIDPGARVSEGDIITRLDDLSEVIVEFALPETLFAQVRTGLGVTATSAAFPERTFEGRIEAVDSRIDPVSRAFRTRAVIPNRDSVLPAGMFMSLTLTLSEAEALVVPEAAIIFQAAETYVFTVTDDIATRVPVKTGQRRGGYVAIEGGLDEGTGVVVRGLQRVRDGGAVTVLDAGDTSDSSSTEGDS